ncbi:MAG: hypothetical protein JXR49_10395 [Acidobacteria bacterium]|nr:hypothetical protein [Acidobacteriota bacterium]
MNNIKLLFFVPCILFVAFIAIASEEPADNELKEAFPLINISTGIVSHIKEGSLAGYFAIFIHSDNWDSLLNDGDIGPFLKIKFDQSDRKALVLMPPNLNEGSIYCVYFNGYVPIGFVEFTVDGYRKVEVDEIQRAYKKVTKEMLKECKEELYFINGNLETDDGKPLSAFKIASAGNKKK